MLVILALSAILAFSVLTFFDLLNLHRQIGAIKEDLQRLRDQLLL